MKPSVTDFLAELYALDPGLQKHEQQLRPLIEHLLQNDPAQSPDPAFVAQLRTQLQSRAAEFSTVSPSFFSTMRKFFTIAIPVAAVAVFIPVVVILQSKNGLPVAPSSPSTETAFEEAGNRAFGPLTDLSPGGMGGGMGGGGGVRDQSGGGGGGMATTAVAPAMDYGTDAKMIAPYPIMQYEYVFSEPITDLTADVFVFKRTPRPSSLPLSSIAGQLNLDSLDLASFGGMNTENISFTQNVPFGYMLHVNLREASLNIDAQWDQWPMSKCTTDACYRAEQVTISQVPPDGQLISIARDFAADHGIDLAAYGEPEVDHSWKIEYDRVTDKSLAYVPEVQRVIFPLMIDGKPVHDQSGIKSGLSIGVHAKHRRVMSVWGIMDRTYAKSGYDGVTDDAAIKKFIGQIDNYGMPFSTMPAGTEVKKVTLTLGKPTVAYTVYFRYTQNKNEELIVPSLIFPVQAPATLEPGVYYRTSIVVPLAKDLLSEQASGGMGGPVLMMEEAVR